MKNFLKNYLPYGCICTVISIIINCTYAIIYTTVINPIHILTLIAVILFLTFISYVLSTINFSSLRIFYTCEYLIFNGVIIIYNLVISNTSEIFLQCLEWIFWSTIVYLAIRYYIYRILSSTAEEINNDLLKLRCNNKKL